MVDGTATLAIDVGGTFTDIAVRESDGTLRFRKVLTTTDTAEEGMHEAMKAADVSLPGAGRLVHGTTLAINALLERRGAVTGLITTAGFRDVLEIGRYSRPEPYNVFYSRVPPLVPRELRLAVSERVSGSGEVLTEPSAQDVLAIVEVFRAAGVQAIAIGFVNSYKNPANEERVAEIVRRHMPECFVTCSSSITRQWREYERFTTASANAYIGPRVEGYLNRLADNMHADGFVGELVVLDSNGGVLTKSLAETLPIRLLESGPVGGVLGGIELCRRTGIPNVVTLDMGGTTAKCAVIENGVAGSLDLYWLAQYERGLPLQVPSVDIVEVGAGGGSIAWLDPVGRLHVGPVSASSEPGPACYGNGGTSFTVTDAHVVAGRVSADEFVGELRLDEDASQAAGRRLSDAAGLTLDRMAAGVLTIANATMANAVRRQTLERGRDPREFVLIGYGGAGPLHACEVAAELGIRRVMIPPSAGTFSAFGMLGARKRFDVQKVYTERLDAFEPGRLAALLAESKRELLQQLGDDEDDVAFDLSLGMRYVGQEFALRVPAPDDLGADDRYRRRLEQDFSNLYRTRYGRTDDSSAIEIVDMVVVGEVRTRPAAGRAVTAPESLATPGSEERGRRMWLGAAFGEGQARIVARQAVTGQAVVAGPCVIYEYGSIAYVPPRWSCQAGPEGWLTIDHRADEADERESR